MDGRIIDNHFTSPICIFTGKKKKEETKSPKVIEINLGTTILPLKDAQAVLKQIQQLKTDQKYSATFGFLSDLFQKLQSLDNGLYSRIEIDMTVRQYQDQTDGFQYNFSSKPIGNQLLSLHIVPH